MRANEDTSRLSDRSRPWMRPLAPRRYPHPFFLLLSAFGSVTVAPLRGVGQQGRRRDAQASVEAHRVRCRCVSGARGPRARRGDLPAGFRQHGDRRHQRLSRPPGRLGPGRGPGGHQPGWHRGHLRPGHPAGLLRAVPVPPAGQGRDLRADRRRRRHRARGRAERSARLAPVRDGSTGPGGRRAARRRRGQLRGAARDVLPKRRSLSTHPDALRHPADGVPRHVLHEQPARG